MQLGEKEVVELWKNYKASCIFIWSLMAFGLYSSGDSHLFCCLISHRNESISLQLGELDAHSAVLCQKTHSF